MDSELITHVRLLLQDSGTPPVVSDTQIANIAKTRRREIYYEGLASSDDLTWKYGRDYIEVTALSLTYEGADILATLYTVDVLAGEVTFTTEQSAIYLKGYVYDLMDIVAQCWLVKAGLLDTYPGMTYSLGDETVSKGEAKEYCIGQYWKFKTSKGGQLRRR